MPTRATDENFVNSVLKEIKDSQFLVCQNIIDNVLV